MNLNLPANAAPPTVAPFNPADPQTYNHTTSTAVYDSLGNVYNATFYFIRTGTANQWQTAVTVDKKPDPVVVAKNTFILWFAVSLEKIDLTTKDARSTKF